MEIVVILWLGFIVSFLGQLPLGNMSFTSTQIGLQEGFQKAWQFAIGVAIVEMIYLRFALTGMDWVIQHRLWFLALGWLTVILFLVLGIVSFITARKQAVEKKPVLLNNKLNRFILGLTMSALNPVQIPFWFLWTSTLIQTKALPIETYAYNCFTGGAGVGTITGLAVYIHGGNWLVAKLNASNKTLNKIMGIIFIITACIQLWRMIYKPFV
ncbi:MAG: LysE family transporter [Sediminibacterium sp.]|nr:LysE family transporter [Sediminibacterium sp.]MBX9778886.1 LysE family translocator [Chitinophagaceae bacterium]